MDAKVYHQLCEHGVVAESELRWQTADKRATPAKENEALLEVYQRTNQLLDQVNSFSFTIAAILAYSGLKGVRDRMVRFIILFDVELRQLQPL